jgi:signal peptide peptidase SppA
MASNGRMGWLSRIANAFGMSQHPVVPVVRLHGVIGMSAPLMRSMTLASVGRQLDRAFAYKRSPAVALLINSPGGSPAQSHFIYQRIRLLAEEKKKKVLVFVEDVAASGGYMIACAGDEIIADPNSVVGSIGVVSASFGFDKLIKKVGIERRVHTAGDNKRQLDPFEPERAEDVKRLKALQKEIHDEFIALVKGSRGTRLSGQDKTLFNGEYWLGRKAMELGLVDEIGEVRSSLRKRYGKDVLTPLVAAPGGFLRGKIPGLSADTLPAELTNGLIAGFEERAWWSRYGL